MALNTVTVLCGHHHYAFPELYHLPKKETLYPKRLTSLYPLPQPLAIAALLSVSLRCLFWGPPVIGIVQRSAFCVWIISLSIRPSRFFCVAACASISFPLKAE